MEDSLRSIRNIRLPYRKIMNIIFAISIHYYVWLQLYQILNHSINNDSESYVICKKD